VEVLLMKVNENTREPNINMAEFIVLAGDVYNFASVITMLDIRH
jgi:hypothetical protein